MIRKKYIFKRNKIILFVIKRKPVTLKIFS